MTPQQPCPPLRPRPPRLVIFTLRESLQAQTLWLCAMVVLALAGLSLATAGAALQEAAVFADTSLYLIVDTGILFLGLLWGARAYTRDFSARGLAEILCPMGFPRWRLLWARAQGTALLLGGATVVLYAGRAAALFVLGGSAWAARGSPATLWITMPLLTFCKGMVAWSLGLCLNTFMAPTISFLSGLFLFLIGFLSTGFKNLDVASHAAPSAVALQQLSPLQHVLLKASALWDPQQLIVAFEAGAWEELTPLGVLRRIAWAAAVTLFGGLIACWRAVRKDIATAAGGNHSS